MLAVMLPTVIETRIQGETATKTEAEMEALFAFDFQHSDWSGSQHIDRDVNVPPCGLGIGTRLVRGVHQGFGDFALHPAG